jgi:serine/threonine protein kinase
VGIVQNLALLALREVVEGVCTQVGVNPQLIGDLKKIVKNLLTERFGTQGPKLTAALTRANQRAWKAVQVALAGETLWDRCKALVVGAPDRAFQQQLRAFLDVCPLPELAGKTAFRRQVLGELNAAQRQGLLTGRLDLGELAGQAGAFAVYADPQAVVAAEWQAVERIVGELKRAGHGNLGWFLSLRPAKGSPLLVGSVRYFFRREVETDAELFRGLAFAQLEQLGQAQEAGFAALAATLTQQGQRLDEMLSSLLEVVTETRNVVVETKEVVLDIRGEIQGQRGQIQELGHAVIQLLEEYRLHGRDLQPNDSLSIRGDGERQLVKALVARYRGLPEDQRRQMPGLLNALGKLQVVAGEFEGAQRDFQTVTKLVSDPRAQAEAHHNAYKVALERRQWDEALDQLLQGVRLDPGRFAPFPVEQYVPQRILGAGGFGVAFLCRQQSLNDNVVVKTLMMEGIGRDVDQVFAEARVLRQLNHPGIIRLWDCAFADPAAKARPYLVMEYFAGASLEDYVHQHGPLAAGDWRVVARATAEALKTAHDRGILHRDVKPANLLVDRRAAGWEVKLIDFGLALRHDTLRSTMTNTGGRTLVGNSVAGTVLYAAPEQMGRLPGVSVGPYSDVYGFGKTCCYALFQTPQPVLPHWRRVPEELGELLSSCIADSPEERPAHFGALLARLAQLPQKLEAQPEPMKPIFLDLPAPPPVPKSQRRPVQAELVREPKKHKTEPPPVPPPLPPAAKPVIPFSATPVQVAQPQPPVAIPAVPIPSSPVKAVPIPPAVAPPRAGPAEFEPPKRRGVWLWWAVGGGALAAVLLIILLIVLLSGSKPSELIIGTWKTTQDNFYMTFRSDGSYAEVEGGTGFSKTGSYHFVDRDTVKITMSKDSITLSIISISNDKMVVELKGGGRRTTFWRSSAPPAGGTTNKDSTRSKTEKK